MKDGVLFCNGRILPDSKITIVGRYTEAMLNLSATSFCFPLLDKHSLTNCCQYHSSCPSEQPIKSCWNRSYSLTSHEELRYLSSKEDHWSRLSRTRARDASTSKNGRWKQLWVLLLTQASPLHRYFTTPNSTSVNLTRLSHHTTREPQLKFGWLFTAAAQLLLLSSM